MSSLFDTPGEPLASRMRPRTLDDFIGQSHIVGPGRLLRRAIQADQLGSLIFSGPPGTGKTTLASVIAEGTKSQFISLNAVLSGVKELRGAIDSAKSFRDRFNRKSILFVDEVHRWNKSQQDALLPWVENGTVILVGATTENPFFEVNQALLSRSRVFILLPLTEPELYDVLNRALSDTQHGYGGVQISIDPDAAAHLVRVSGGDARTLLNALELAVETGIPAFPPEPDEIIHITLEDAEESIQQRAILYDKDGDYHFDTISAFIKSVRGSDPDASLYWLARMVAAGENPRFIFRRLLILASEDVGLADPHAISVVHACADAFERVGLPEGQFHLAHATLYLALAKKSNSTLAYFSALEAVKKARTDVPLHLRDASRDGPQLGHGASYKYPHAYSEHWVRQQYLPAALQGIAFYSPGSTGWEGDRAEIVESRRAEQIAESFESTEEHLVIAGSREKNWFRPQAFSPPPPEITRKLQEWIIRSLGLLAHHRVLVYGENIYSVTQEILKICIGGTVYADPENPTERGYLQLSAGYALAQGSLVLLNDDASAAGYYVDRVLYRPGISTFYGETASGSGFNPYSHGDVLTTLKARLSEAADRRIFVLVPDIAATTRLSDIFEESGRPIEFLTRAETERAVDPVSIFQSALPNGDFTILDSNTFAIPFQRRFDRATIESWIAPGTAVGSVLSDGERNEILAAAEDSILSRSVSWNRVYTLQTLIPT